MLKKVAFLVITFFVFVSAKSNVENPQFDNHIIKKSNNKIISEEWRRNKTHYIANYNENGDIVNFNVTDKNFGFLINVFDGDNDIISLDVSGKNYEFIMNMEDGTIISYVISGKGYYRLNNFSEEGEIVTAREKTLFGTYNYEKDFNGK